MSASDGVEVTSVAKAVDGRTLFVELVLPRPSDIAAYFFGATNSIWPGRPQLIGTPVWTHPFYLDYRRPDSWPVVEPPDHLSFIGRVPAGDHLDLVFRYPTVDGRWKDVSLPVDLSSASALTGEEPPAKRWANAQATWFQMLSRVAGDVGGFFAYAAGQTRRMYDLGSSSEGARMPPFRGSDVRRPEDQYYAVLSGALAVQESLQLDRMINPTRESGSRTLPIADITAVSVQSHPFDEMRADRKPVHGGLATVVPEDFYFLRFRNIGRFLDMLDYTRQWGGSLLRLAKPVGTDHRTRERTLSQLCLADSLATRLLGSAVVKEIALCGSDPYLVNGSDISVAFHVRSKEAFQAAVAITFQQALRTHADAVHDHIDYEGVGIERLIDSNRHVSCHRFWLGDTCVYSNSLSAAKRIIDVCKKSHPALADAADFRYMRAVVFPLDDEKEDGFLYLSDSFIRNVVGPELRIKRKRRLETATSLKMLTNAVLLHGYLHGPGSVSFQKLFAAGVLNPDEIYDSEGGVISWDETAGIASSSTFGDLRFLKPLIEMEADLATEKEAAAYTRFRERYQSYWRRYFDPIGIRIRFRKTIELETHILPLINLSAYSSLKDIAGGEPITVRQDGFTKNTLLRLDLHLNDGAQKRNYMSIIGGFTGTNATSDWLGDWATFWIEDTDAYATLIRQAYASEGDSVLDRSRRSDLDVFNSSIVFGVHVRNNVSLAVFLVAMRAMINNTAPNTVVFNNLEPYHGVTIIQIAPDPQGELLPHLKRPPAESQAAEKDESSQVAERSPAIYYATIGDGFYIATQASALRALVDKLQDVATKKPSEGETLAAHAFLYVAPSAAELIRPTALYVLEQQAREVSWRNLVQVWVLGRCGVLERDSIETAAERFLGYRLVCPSGGEYRYDAVRGESISTVYGPISQPARFEEPPDSSPLRGLLESVDTIDSRLTFTEHGLAAQLAIHRRDRN
ncbi:MAG: hypothetical protein IH897_08890 [Planctomycetes bacterium]|nr:hypothetical protein [Planctomycetota bacterium]